MNGLFRNIKKALARDNDGATAVEYGLLLSLMVIALVGALGVTGDRTQEKWEGVAEDIEAAAEEAKN